MSAGFDHEILLLHRAVDQIYGDLKPNREFVMNLLQVQLIAPETGRENENIKLQYEQYLAEPVCTPSQLSVFFLHPIRVDIR